MNVAAAFAWVALLLAPTASAWSLDVSTPVDWIPSVRSSLLVAGDLSLDESPQVFGAIGVTRVDLSSGAVIEQCPDSTGQATRPGCTGGEITNGAVLRVVSGGIVVRPAGGTVKLDAPAATAALGGSNLTVNLMRTGSSVFVGGALTLVATATSFEVRPIGTDARIEVFGDGQVRIYDGPGYTLYVTATTLRVEANGGFAGMPEGVSLSLSEAPLATAERGLSAPALATTLRALVPTEAADRRSDLATAFGPFQVAPALLNGALATPGNATWNGAPTTNLTLARVTDARIELINGSWEARGNATLFVRDDTITPAPSETATLPWVLAGIVALIAIVARFLSHRDEVPRRRRMLTRTIRGVGAALAFLIAVWSVARVLSVNALTEAAALSTRTQTQLLLLAGASALLAYALIGISTSSLVRSLLARFLKRQAPEWGALGGFLATVILLWLASFALISAAARFVRL